MYLKAIPLVLFGVILFPIQLSAEVIGHPHGCPRRAFCGCGASVHLFGHPVRSLFLSSNWLKFPRATPGRDMVAVRRGHVFVLKEQVDGNTWLVFDANSGGRATRMHNRSIAGYTIVNPRGGSPSSAMAFFQGSENMPRPRSRPLKRSRAHHPEFIAAIHPGGGN